MLGRGDRIYSGFNFFLPENLPKVPQVDKDADNRTSLRQSGLPSVKIKTAMRNANAGISKKKSRSSNQP